MESFRQACALKFVLKDLTILVALELSVKLLSIFIDQVVLDISSTAGGELSITCQRDMNFVWCQICIELLLVNHRVDFHECGRRLQLVLSHELH